MQKVIRRRSSGSPRPKRRERGDRPAPKLSGPRHDKLACTHPGKLGDALYALPTIRELSRRHGKLVDFYTSSYCEPLRKLFEAQHCIDRFIVAPRYVLRDFSCGGQPWQIPIDEPYAATYQLGFRGLPHEPLPDYISASAHLPPGLPIRYDFEPTEPEIDEPYIVVAPRPTIPVFRELPERSPVRIVEIGGAGEGTGSPLVIDKTGIDMLDVLPLLARARAFVGYHSAMLVLANGFPIPKVVWTPPGAFWLHLHAVKSYYNHYPVEPDATAIFRHLGGPMSYCKTLDPIDYQTIHEMQHAKNIKAMVGTFGGRAEHEHRAWEYGLVLRAIREYGAVRVLDVGGGGSNFAPAAAWIDMKVTQVDPDGYGPWVAEQSRKIGKPIEYVQQDFMAYDGPKDFDAVVSISVMEHVGDDDAFYRKLASHVRVGGVLAVTVDFWPDGGRKSACHLRTYTHDRLVELARSVPGFRMIGQPDYAHLGQYVYDYTFASLVVQRVE